MRPRGGRRPRRVTRERLLGEPATARAMGARGRARVFAGGLWSHVAARLESALTRTHAPRGKAA